MARNWLVEFRVKQKKVDGKWEPTRDDVLSLVKKKILGGGFPPTLAESLKCINKTTTGSKARGSDYERRVAKVLGAWWWGKPFRRTPNSGGWDKQTTDGEVMAAGDLIAPEEAKFPFCVECKHRKEHLNLFAQQTGSSDCVFDWWDQCVQDANTSKKEPLLIMSCGRVEYVAFTSGLFDIVDAVKLPDSIVRVYHDYHCHERLEGYFEMVLLKQLLEGKPYGKEERADT